MWVALEAIAVILGTGIWQDEAPAGHGDELGGEDVVICVSFS